MYIPKMETIMKKILSSSSAIVLALLTLNGCGGDSKSSSPTGGTQVSSTQCIEEYFNSNVSNSLNACVSCHSSGGQAGSTGFVLESPLIDNKSANLTIVKNFIKSTGTLIVDKGTNNTAHVGGVAMNSSAANTMQTFIAYTKGTKLCLDETNIGSISANAISLIEPQTTLRNAALKLSGSTPTDDIIDEVTSINSIDAKLDEYMESDYFYTWLGTKFNDFLLTDFYAPGRDAEDLLSGTDFPERYWYDEFRTGNNTDAPNMFTNDERYRMYRNVNYAISREPINLMLHVIKNDRPFSEILTADYLLVNPYSARTYGKDIDGFSFSNDDLNLSIEDIQAKYDKDDLREVKLDGIPHAGVLTTVTYLNKFPSTNTNLDRHRSAKTQLFFFDTDILALANRPIAAVDVIGNSATWTNPNCTVCHNVMEPISSAFSNWDNDGRYRAGWRVDLAPFSQEPGVSLEKKAPPSVSNNILQWLTKEMVQDDRFAMSSVKMFVKVLLGREALKKPQTDDIDYVQALQAYNYENAILKEIMTKFKASDMNAKVIIKEIIKSPLYRAKAIDIDNEVLANNLGQAKLITPEELDTKIYDKLGYYWNRYRSSTYQYRNSRDHRLLAGTYQGYHTLYGGINSGSISKRIDELNGVMANIQMRMAVQMGCFPVTRDFFFPLKDRKLFPYVLKTQEPITEGSISDIKKNIQYLHKHLLGEELTINDSEIEATYKIFYDTYLEGKERVFNGDESRNLLDECRMYYDPVSFERFPNRQNDIVNDDNYVIRSWSAVITYLLSDFKFLYETSGE